MVVQVIEFWGWIQEIITLIQTGNSNLDYSAWLFFLVQVGIFSYCINFIKSGQFFLEFPAYIFFWLDFVGSLAFFSYTAVLVFINQDNQADLLALVVLTVFLGSDILMSGGMLYLMNNYTPDPIINHPPVVYYIIQQQPLMLNDAKIQQMV